MVTYDTAMKLAKSLAKNEEAVLSSCETDTDYLFFVDKVDNTGKGATTNMSNYATIVNKETGKQDSITFMQYVDLVDQDKVYNKQVVKR